MLQSVLLPSCLNVHFIRDHIKLWWLWTPHLQNKINRCFIFFPPWKIHSETLTGCGEMWPKARMQAGILRGNCQNLFWTFWPEPRLEHAGNTHSLFSLKLQKRNSILWFLWGETGNKMHLRNRRKWVWIQFCYWCPTLISAVCPPVKRGWQFCVLGLLWDVELPGVRSFSEGQAQKGSQSLRSLLFSTLQSDDPSPADFPGPAWASGHPPDATHSGNKSGLRAQPGSREGQPLTRSWQGPGPSGRQGPQPLTSWLLVSSSDFESTERAGLSGKEK